MLERFYDVQKGKILCNDTDISELDIHEYRKAISLVAQEPTLFEGTIKENIYLGVDESTPENTLHQVCRDAEIHDFIMSLPDGYNTNVGAKGVALSGGQKQRISIARALIRNPNILLLDEATSSLDSESEKLVQAAFERAATGRTMVVVAHRLATVQNADVIFVLGEGKVLEMGDHAALLRKKGVYYQMVSHKIFSRSFVSKTSFCILTLPSVSLKHLIDRRAKSQGVKHLISLCIRGINSKQTLFKPCTITMCNLESSHTFQPMSWHFELGNVTVHILCILRIN